VQAFQREYGLTADGQVGVVTWDAITGVYSEMKCGAGKRPYQAPGYIIR
jgi:murein L,D-transpeptidase YcbB/YkuD